MEDNMNLGEIAEVIEVNFDNGGTGLEAAGDAVSEITEKGGNTGLVVLGVAAAGAAIGAAYYFIKKKLKNKKAKEEVVEAEEE